MYVDRSNETSTNNGGGDPVCGDGVCEAGEDANNCAADCDDGGGADCPAGYTKYEGTISAGELHVSAGASTRGTFHAPLTGSGPDLDLALQRQRNNGSWTNDASSAGATQGRAGERAKPRLSVTQARPRPRLAVMRFIQLRSS